MSGISALYFLDKKGQIIIYRNYRGEVNQNISDNFNQKVLELDECNMKPVFTINNVHYCWIKHSNIYIVTVSKRNINIALVITFLYELKKILIDYFYKLEEETIKDNFVLIYEILDEIMDHGYPQATDSQILKSYIMTESNRGNFIKDKTKEEENDNNITQILTSKISWRKEGIFYNKNEAYLTIEEYSHMLISPNGDVLDSSIKGTMMMKSSLSGMPSVTLKLNDKIHNIIEDKNDINTIEIDNLQFHQCVDKKAFQTEKKINFIPPDGDFELINYRFKAPYKPLFLFDLKINNISETKVTYVTKIKANFTNKLMGKDIEIYIPVPPDVESTTYQTQKGTVCYSSNTESILWTIKQLPGEDEATMSCSYKVPTIRIDNPNNFMKRTIKINFEIPYYTVSGIEVRYIKIVDKLKYEAIPWVRYITKSGEYNIRII